MSKEFVVKLVAPLAVSASILAAAFMMSSAPTPARADIPATPTNQQLPVQGGVPSLEPMLKPVMPAIVNISVTGERSEEHTSELQSLMRISYAVFCLKKTTDNHTAQTRNIETHTSM